MSGHINLQTSWFLALLESAIMGSGVGKEMCVCGGEDVGGEQQNSIRLHICKGRGLLPLELFIEIPPNLFCELIYRQHQEKELRNPPRV